MIIPWLVPGRSGLYSWRVFICLLSRLACRPTNSHLLFWFLALFLERRQSWPGLESLARWSGSDSACMPLTRHKIRRLRGKRVSDQEWDRKVSKRSNTTNLFRSSSCPLMSRYYAVWIQILCGLDSARKNALLILAMMVLLRKSPFE